MKTEYTNILSSEAKEILSKKESSNNATSSSAVKFSSSMIAILLSFLIGTILIVLASNFADNAQDYNALTLYEQIWKKNFGTMTAFTEMLSRMSYLLPLGLALVVSFRMGIFNIGAAGQSFLGGTVAFVIGSTLKIGSLGFLVTIAAGVFTGMAVAGLIAFLKNKFNINEVISSIMLNWVILYVVMQFRTNIDEMTLLENNDLRFEFIDNIFLLFGDQVSSTVNLGIIIMIPLAIVFAFMYGKTKWGYKQNLIGNNPHTGKYLGINSQKEIFRTMLISGGLAGLAGTIYLTGFGGSHASFSASELVELPATTFDGIAIALIGYNSPFGIIASSFLFSLLKATDLDVTIGSFRIVEIIMGLMIIFIAASALKVKYGKKGGAK